MAYFNQEKKAKIAPAIKALLKQYGLQGSLAVRNHSTVVLNIRSGQIDFITNYNDCERANPQAHYKRYATTHVDVNPHSYDKYFAGVALEFLEQAFKILNTDNFDHSDSVTDYFHVGHYVDVNIGDWEKPYIVTESYKEAA